MGTLRQWLYRYGIRYHAQNLTQDDGGPRRALWRAGRAWVTLFVPGAIERDEDGDYCTINHEWHVRLQRHAGLGLTIGDGDSDSEVQVYASGPLGSVYLTIEGHGTRWHRVIEGLLPGYWIDRSWAGYAPDYRHHTTGGPGRLKITQPIEVKVDIHNGTLWWSLWNTVHEWHSSTPRWRHGSFDVVDALLGRHIYIRDEDITERRALASFPEGSYPLLLRRITVTYLRPRWPWARIRRYVDIRAGTEAGGDAPRFRGKGENSYDLDDDAILGMSSEGHSYEDAVGKYVAAVLHSRGRYGHISPSHRAIVETG